MKKKISVSTKKNLKIFQKSLVLGLGFFLSSGIIFATSSSMDGEKSDYTAGDALSSVTFNNLVKTLKDIFNDNGNIGIGVASPVEKLEVNGTGRFIGNLTSNGEIISTSANAYRTVQGNYGTFFRNDGASLWLMLTNAGDQYGGWNGLRPFTVNLSSGNVHIGTSLSVGGKIKMSQTTVSDSDDTVATKGYVDNKSNVTNCPDGYSLAYAKGSAECRKDGSWQTSCDCFNGRNGHFYVKYENGEYYTKINSSQCSTGWLWWNGTTGTFQVPNNVCKTPHGGSAQFYTTFSGPTEITFSGTAFYSSGFSYCSCHETTYSF